MKPSPIRPRAQHHGQAIVEFALVLPILLLLLYGIVEVSRLTFIYLSVHNASRQAARYGATAGLGESGPRYLDCEGIRDIANQSALIAPFDDINITYDRGTTGDGTQIPISGVSPSPDTNSCPIEGYFIQNGDRIIVQVSASYEPIVSAVPIDPLKIVSSSARTFLVSVPILGSALPTGFRGETSTPSQTTRPTEALITPTFTLTLAPTEIRPTVIPGFTFTPGPPTQRPTSTRVPTITPSPINCSAPTGISHGPLTILEDYMEMQINNNTGHTLSTAQVYVEWNHDTGHQPGTDSTLHLRRASLANASWTGDLFVPSAYFPGFYPPIPQGASILRFEFDQTYNNTDGTERIIITIATPGCTNYPVDSRN